MSTSTQAATLTEVRTLVITLAVGGAFAIAAAFLFGWHAMDRDAAQAYARAGVTSLASDIVEVPR